MVVPAMIETTSVEGAAKDFNVAPASRNICGLSATTSVATAPTSLRRRIEANAFRGQRADLVGGMRLDHARRGWHRAPAPASPTAWRRPSCPRRRGRWCRRFVSSDLSVVHCDILIEPVSNIAVMAGLVPAIHDLHASPQDVDARDKPGHDDRGGFDFRRIQTPYASPSVSNIAALMASAADLPAQTTNWNAG